jgi:hypothetical protein
LFCTVYVLLYLSSAVYLFPLFLTALFYVGKLYPESRPPNKDIGPITKSIRGLSSNPRALMALEGP